MAMCSATCRRSRYRYGGGSIRFFGSETAMHLPSLIAKLTFIFLPKTFCWLIPNQYGTELDLSICGMAQIDSKPYSITIQIYNSPGIHPNYTQRPAWAGECEKSPGRPVSRVLFPRLRAGDDHFSRRAVTRALQQPTRE